MRALLKEILHAVEIAQALFPNSGDKQQRSACLEASFVHGFDNRQKVHEATTVIGQAGAEPASPLLTAVSDAARHGVSGKQVSSFLLARVRELTSGASQPANVALVVNNARLAAQIACAFAARDQRSAPDSNVCARPTNDATTARGGRGRRGRANSLTAVRTLRRVPQTEPDPSTAE